MAKTLLHSSKYEVLKESNRIQYEGNISLEKLLLITNVTANKVVYQFNDPAKGGETTFLNQDNQTNLDLSYDLSADADIEETDVYQFFYDKPEVHFEPSETFLDPVSKIRVSNPENLIDTDFEYGLQSTKWETIQTVNNIPTVFSSSGDTPIEGITSVDSLKGSKQVKVSATVPHNLNIGDPVSCQGLLDYQAEGFFVVSGVSSPTVFFFEIDVPSTTSGDISGSYTTIVPAKFFEGAPLNVNTSSGATTDEANPSKISVETEATHGFTAGTKLYLRNTIGPKKLIIEDPTATAPDNRPYVDTDAFFAISNAIDTTASTGRAGFQEPVVIAYDWESTYTRYLIPEDIDAVNNRITWDAHEFENKFTLLFNTPYQGQTNIGIADGSTFWVKVIDANTIELYTEESLSNQVTLGTYDNTQGQCRLGLVYVIQQSSGYDRYTRYYKEQVTTGSTGYLYTPNQYTYGGVYSYVRVDNTLGFTPDLLNVNSIQIYGQDINSYNEYVYIRFDNGRAYNAARFYTRNYTWVGAGVPNQTLSSSQIYRSGSASYVRTYTDKSGSVGGYYRFRFTVYGEGFGSGGTDWSGSDLADYGYGLGQQQPDAVIAYQGKTPSSYNASSETYSYLGNQRNKGRYGTIENQYNNQISSVYNDGRFRINYFGGSLNDANSQAFYVFIRKLLTDRNTFYKAGHDIVSGTEATIVVNATDYAAGQRFSFSNSNGDTTVMGQEFQAVLNSVSDDIFRIQANETPFTDDVQQFPENFEIQYRVDNILYNTVYVNNHKITGTSEATLLVEGNNESTPEIYSVEQNASAWVMNGSRLGLNQQDPGLILYRGETYNFVTDALVSETFYLTTSDADAWVSGSYVGEYTSGVTGSRATAGGTLTIVVPSDAPDSLYYAAGTDAELFGTIQVRAAGTAIGGTANNTDYNLNRVNDSRLSLQQTTNTEANGTTSIIGAQNSNPGSASINSYSPLGLTPTNVSITGIQFRGDFSGRNEYVVLTFSDNDSYFIGQSGGVDSDQWQTEQFFGTKNITDLVDGSGNFTVNYAPTSQINFSPGSMTNNWEIRFIVSGGTGVVTLSSGGTGEQVLEVGSLKGAYDGVFEMVEVDNPNTFKVQTDFEIPARNYSFTEADAETVNMTVTFAEPHNFVTGEKVEYLNNGNDNIAIFDEASFDGFLYIIVIDETTIKFSISEQGAEQNINIDLDAAATGTYTLKGTSVIKAIKGVGTVDVVTGSNVVIGSGTSFLTQFKRFDKIWIKQNDYTKQYTIDQVTENERMVLFNDITDGGTATEYFFITEFVLRPDGYGIHLPFDGGVNITAGTSPDSKIARQSRKYFRYQSGKGIQNSFAINFNPPKIVRDLIKASGTTAKINAQEAHNLKVGDPIVIEGAEVSVGNNTFNGNFTVSAVNSAFQFEYEMSEQPTQQKAAGFPTYHRETWTDSFVRAGMFDDQNGFFYEYDGQKLYAVRRSSTLQMAGTINVVRQSQIVIGNETSFTTQMNVNEYVVIRGQSYKVVEVSSDSRIIIQPPYRGVDAKQVKMTKTEDARVPQDEWNIDVCDGTGEHGYFLNINRIQMAYADYSWYGAGKIRFGFKDQHGHVKYVHEFKHNNILNESYFRSGNLPGRYEITNGPQASTAPTLFHFGTSVIMDGTFDDDKAYLFTANSKPFAFTNGGSTNISSTANSTFEQITLNGNRVWVYAFQCSESNASSVFTGAQVSEPGGNLPNGTYVSQVQIAGASSKIFTSYPATTTLPPTSIYPVINSSTSFTIGEIETIDLTRPIPLISIRLAPSVDSSLTGVVGEREIINRMQLTLKQAGVTANQDIEVFLILNPQPSNMDFQKVNTPSLSELIEYNAGDTLEAGTVVYAVKASSGSQEIDLSELIELGNSILGGDSIFPSGPDLLTVAVQPQNTSGISTTNPFTVSGKVSWSESQA